MPYHYLSARLLCHYHMYIYKYIIYANICICSAIGIDPILDDHSGQKQHTCESLGHGRVQMPLGGTAFNGACSGVPYHEQTSSITPAVHTHTDTHSLTHTIIHTQTPIVTFCRTEGGGPAEKAIALLRLTGAIATSLSNGGDGQ